MLVLHEDLACEAGVASEAVERVFKIPSLVRAVLIQPLLRRAPQSGRYTADPKPLDALREGHALCLAVVRQPLFSPNKPNPTADDWWFAGEDNGLIIMSIARLGRPDPSPGSQYLRRIAALAAHEAGHGVVHGSHLLEAWYVNPITLEEDYLGPHCTDPRCIMYESIDVQAPAPEQGYLRLGGECRFDAGLDDLLRRMSSEWLCLNCERGITPPSSPPAPSPS